MNKSAPNTAKAGSPGVTFQEVSDDHAGQRLDNYLLARLKGVPKSRIYRIIRKGEVRVNKKREKPEYKLQPGDLLRIPPVRTAQPGQQLPPTESLQQILHDSILYQDECLMVINKPSGLPVHAGTGVKIGLIEALRYMLPALTGLELVHRLDKGTSGCLLLALNNRTLKTLSAQFKHSEVRKIYHALVEGQWPADLSEISAALEKQTPRGGERVVTVSATGKAAQTGFTVLTRYADSTLIQASPVTGRTHQIRVHAQLAGHPIIGDEKYQQAAPRSRYSALGIKRLCLHAAELSFNHPENGERVKVTASKDEQFLDAQALLKA